MLFPYAREHLPEFIRNHQAETEVAELLVAARSEAGKVLNIEQLIAQFIEWLDADLKITPLKALQGLIWEAGYQQGAFDGHVYEDAARQLQAFKDKGLALYIYSSGSVYAQKMLFGHTKYGDLCPLFSGYFDTNIGGKKEVLSYQRIAEQINLQPMEILFLSDIKEELDAALQAGFQTYWLVREQCVDSQADHRQITDFDAIQL